MMYDDAYFMGEALKEAKKAFDADEVPVGAVVVAENRIIARAHNLTETLTDVTAHAEMQVITAAANAIGGKYLTDCTIYVSLEPCVMCAGAIAWSQVYGAADPKKGFTLLDKNILHPKTQVSSGVLADISERLLKDFFNSKRK
jgi:tRNA(adenine34) deaminase